MLVDEYFSSTLVGIGTSAALGGSVAIASALAAKPKQYVLLHAALPTTYIPLAYFAGGFGFLFDGSPVALFIMFSIFAASLHIHFALRTGELRRTRQSLEAARVRTTELELRSADVEEDGRRIRRITDLDVHDAYPTLDDPSFLSRLQELSRKEGAVTVVAPSSEILAAPMHSAFLGALMSLRSAGVRINIVHAPSRIDALGSLASGGREVIVSAESLPSGFVVILVGSTVVLGIQPHPTEPMVGPMLLGNYTGIAGSGSLPGTVLRLVQYLLSDPDGGSANARVDICNSPYGYHHLIVAAEERARRIDRIPKRISVLFKGDELIEFLAIQRFGRGSPNISEYRAEHVRRREIFFEGLRTGRLICRELYNMDSVVHYLGHLTHAGAVAVPQKFVRDMVLRWRHTMQEYPNNYLVGLTHEEIPINYQICDEALVVLHAAIGGSDLHRLNAYSLASPRVARSFKEDFDVVWSRIPASVRSLGSILRWIDTEVLAKFGGDTDERNKSTPIA